MKIVTDIKDANDLLMLYSGALFQISAYSESLKRITIRLKLSTMPEVLYLVGIRCERINGCFSFENASLSISSETDDKSREVTKICDKSLGFELITLGGFSLAQDIEANFGSSFHNFLSGNR